MVTRLTAEDQYERRREAFIDSLDNLLKVMTPEQEREHDARVKAAKTVHERLEDFKEACRLCVKVWERAGDNRPEWEDMEDVIELMRRLA